MPPDKVIQPSERKMKVVQFMYIKKTTKTWQLI